MEKRLILAVVLSLLVLLSWSAFLQKISPPSTTPTTERVTFTPSDLLKPLPEPEALPSALFNFSINNSEIIFIEPQAAIKEIIFKDYQSHRFPLKYGFWLQDKNLEFKKQKISPDKVSFIYKDDYKEITKRFIFAKSNYSIDLELEVNNISDTVLKIDLPIVLGVLDFARHPLEEARYQDLIVASADQIFHLNGHKEMSFNTVKFLGLRDRYFCTILEPAQNNYRGFIRKINSKESEIGLGLKEIALAPGQKLIQKFRIYMGPQDLRIINNIKSDWTAVVYFGAFDFIAQILLQILEFLYRFVHNWGWTIVILSFLIYIVLFPLSLKQMHSMKQMQAIQPRIEELRKMYKDNPQRLNKEVMELYREHKINPFGGCLPLILQMPIFFALYQVFTRSIVLKGAQFIWIKDLSKPDCLFTLPIPLPIIGNEFNILPILMAIGMFIQQKISTVNTSVSSREQQRLMLILFPIMFGLIFYHMPAGLVLYWFINGILMLAYQIRVFRVK